MVPPNQVDADPSEAEQIKIEKEKVISELKIIRDYLLAKSGAGAAAKKIINTPLANTENGK